MEKMLNEEQLQQEAATLVQGLTPRDSATVVALHGNLGAGKTALTQAMGRALGIKESIPSPTFLIERMYHLHGQVFTHLIHIDAYRVSNADELRVLGWDELVQDPRNLVVVEWGERVEELLPEHTKHIHISYINDDMRAVSYANSTS